MKRNLIILTILLLTCYFGFAQNFSGTYNTDFREMTITQNGNKVTGTYKYQNGRLEGTLNGHTLTGFWYQDNGKGKLVFEFNSDFSGFTGKWGYNDAAPTSKWNGTLIGGGQAITTSNTEKVNGIFNTDFKEMTLSQSGNKVTGTYKYQNGRVEGTLNGHTLTGFWYQDNGKGKLVFEFNSDFSGFIGKWGYNDAAPTSKWNGTRIGGGQAIITSDAGFINGVFNTDFKEMTLSQSGNKVTGTYKYQNGRVEGTLNGHTLTGFWYQDNGKGKFVFEFNSDFSGFTGKWGYNDAAPTSKWNGTKTGESQMSSSSQQSTGQITQPSVPKITSDLPTGTSSRLNVDLNNTDVVAGELMQNAIQLSVLKGTFDQKVELEVKENRTVPQFDKKRANLIGTPFEITIDQKSKRLNRPVQVKLKLERTEIAALNHPGDLWIGYFNGKSWDYFKPLEVNLSEKYVKFETYHFSDYAKAELTKGEMINDFAYKNAVNHWAENDNNALTRQATEQMVNEILSKKMGLNNKSLAQDVVEAIMQENDYTTLLVNYNDRNMEDFSQNVAVLAGKKICDIVTSDSNAKGLLGIVTEHSSKVGAGIKIATALSEGDGETAAKELSLEIMNSFPLTKLLTTTAQLTEMQISRWKDQELEAAYQVFVNGAESSIPFWGYQVEPGNFEEVWAQMRGLEAKINDDAIKNYATLKNMSPDDLNTVVLDKIRRDTKANLRLEFEKRKNQESKIETIKAENVKLISEFEGANLLSYNRFGFTDATTFDFRLERLFRIKDMILKDTKSRLGFSGINSGDIISSKTVANLIQIWYSENGKEKYRQELIRLGYKKEEKKPVVVETKTQQPVSGTDLEGVWVGSITHSNMTNYWSNPDFEWLEGVNSRPLLILLYQAGDQSKPEYRGLYWDLRNGGIATFSNETPAILSGFKNDSFSYRQEISDGHMDPAFRIWKATKLKTPLSAATFPGSVNVPSLESGSAKYIEEKGVKEDIDNEGTIQTMKDAARVRIQETKEFYKQTPIFQRTAAIWLKERKFKLDGDNLENNLNFDRTNFEKLFKDQLKVQAKN